MRLAFIDTETTGLDPKLHEIWEVAYVLVDNHGHTRDTTTFQLPVDLENADAHGLTVGKFHDRYNGEQSAARYSDARSVLLHDLRDAVLVGNNVAFDAAFLREFLGSAPWHYHVVDVKALVAGKLGLLPPWDTADLLARAGLPVEKRHEAPAGCQQAKALFDWVYLSDCGDGFEAMGVSGGIPTPVPSPAQLPAVSS